MEVILKENIKNLGYKDDVVNVKPGYGRNFLIPQGKAIMATVSSKKVVEENIRQASNKLAQVKKEAEAFKATLEKASIKVGAKVGESGKIFGAVTTIQVAEGLNRLGYEVDRRNIELKDNIKALGTYTAIIDLHKEVKANVEFEVVAE